MIRRRPRSWLSLRQRRAGRWSNAHAALLTAAALVLSVAVIVTLNIRHERLTGSDGDAWPFSVAWDQSWPSLPVVGVAGALSDEVARLEQVRADIEREYSSRGPATLTPPVPVN